MEASMVKNLIPWDWFKGVETDSKRTPASIINQPFSKLYSEMEKIAQDVFNEYLPDIPKTSELGVNFLTPRLNISETEKEYKVSVEIPGVKEKEIDLSINKNVLMIKAHKKEEKEDKDERYHRIERYYGTFQRSIALPEDAKQDSVEAKFKDGVLNIIIEKNKEMQSNIKKIEVKGE